MTGIVLPMTDSGKLLPVAAIALLAAMLSGCAGSPGGASDETLGRVLFAPGKYALYKCEEIADRTTANLARQHVLEELMAKASEGAGGRMASSVAYRPEYLELRGEMFELRRVAVEKQCKFVPGARASDSTVR